jgi:hypothetical protein
MDLVSGVVVFILLWWWVFLMARPCLISTGTATDQAKNADRNSDCQWPVYDCLLDY